MTRNELVIAALEGGHASTAAIAQATGLAERACRYRLRWLIREGYAWSPERGRYRLTAWGRAIAAEVRPLAAPHPPAAGPGPDPGDCPGHGVLRRHRYHLRGSE